LLKIQQADKRRGIINPQPDANTLLSIEKLVLYLEGKGKFGFIEVATLFLSQAAAPMDIETAKKLKTILKYPDQYEILKSAIKTMIEQLNQLLRD
jgi:hypothetical protein